MLWKLYSLALNSVEVVSPQDLKRLKIAEALDKDSELWKTHVVREKNR